MSVVPDSAVTMLSEGGVGFSVKWGTKLYYGDVASGTCKKNITTTNYSMIIIRNKKCAMELEEARYLRAVAVTSTPKR